MKRSFLCTTSDTDCPPFNSKKGYAEEVNSRKKSKVTWTGWDFKRYKDALAVYGKDWKKVAGYIRSKTPNQVKSRYQRMTKGTQKEGERNILLDQRQAIIHKYVEANVDITSAQMEKATCSPNTCEILMCDELFKHIFSNPSIALLERSTITLEIAAFAAAELIREDVHLPIRENNPSTANLPSMNQPSVNEADFYIPPEVSIARTGNQQSLHSKRQQLVDTFNDFSKKNHRYAAVEFGSKSC